MSNSKLRQNIERLLLLKRPIYTEDRVIITKKCNHYRTNIHFIFQHISRCHKRKFVHNIFEPTALSITAWKNLDTRFQKSFIVNVNYVHLNNITIRFNSYLKTCVQVYNSSNSLSKRANIIYIQICTHGRFGRDCFSYHTTIIVAALL